MQNKAREGFSHKLVRALLVLLFLIPSLSYAVPKIEHWVLDNGVRVYFVETHDLPMVAMQVVFDAGSARDPEALPGLSLLMSGLLNEGTDGLDADAIAARFERVGAQFGASNDRDMIKTTLRSLSDPALLGPAVELYAQLLRAPSFPPASLERERAQALLALQVGEQSPGDVAAKAFYAQLYDRHPYARPPQGTEAGLKAITREDLHKFHSQYFTGRNAVLALIGDLDRRTARTLAAKLVGRLPAGTAPPPLPRVEDLVPHVSRAEKVIAHPSTQTHILIGETGISRNDPDYFPLFVGNYILGGGGFVSRLTKAVRDQRGLSYSVHSYFLPLREPGPFVLGLQTRNDQTREALKVVRTVLAEFIQNGPTETELLAAKKNLAGGFPLRIESNRKILDYLAIIGFYNLPHDYLDRFVARVEAVTVDEVRDAFRRRIHPPHMVTVIVGGAAD